jgi:hypothetical protein
MYNTNNVIRFLFFFGADIIELEKELFLLLQEKEEISNSRIHIMGIVGYHSVINKICMVVINIIV